MLDVGTLAAVNGVDGVMVCLSFAGAEKQKHLFLCQLKIYVKSYDLL